MVLVVAGAGTYAAWASGTAPFSSQAYAAVAVPAAGLGGLVVLRRRAGAPRVRAPSGIPAGRSADHVPSATAVPWLALSAVVVAVELASYFHGGSRSSYPTISSGVEVLFRHRAVEAAAFFGWLAGGWWLVRS